MQMPESQSAGSGPGVSRSRREPACCIRDGSWPPEIGLQEPFSNHPVRLRSKGVVVSDCGKGVVQTSGKY